MAHLMRCNYCGLLQDEPAGVKACVRCGGELSFEAAPPPGQAGSYLQVQLELDQVAAPAGRNVDRFLLATIRTPKQVPPEQAAPSISGRPPVNFVAVLDISGSMQGEKLRQAKEAVRRALLHLKDGDWFSLVTFNDQVACAYEPAAFTGQTGSEVGRALDSIRSGGTTALCGGLELGLKKALTAKKDNNLVLLLSDGQANVGETDLEVIGMYALEGRRQGLTVSTIGIGLDYNEALMVEISNQGGGRFYHIQAAHQIPAFVAGELGEAASIAAKDARIVLDLPPGSAVIPVSAAYLAQQNGSQAEIALGDIPCDTELEVPIRLTLPAQPAGARPHIEGRVDYRSPAGNALSAALNRVTVRITAPGEFQLLEGVVSPVVEVVFKHRKATNVIASAKAFAAGTPELEKQAQEERTGLLQYAVLLGEERAKEEQVKIKEQLDFAASPVAAKQAVYQANFIQRGSKDFNKK